MNLLFLFAYICGLTLTLPLLFPSLRLFYFSPFLVFCFYRNSFSSCLWWALLCGLIVDLLSNQTRLGTYALNYCLTTAFLYGYKQHFFEDRLSTLPVMTFCFAILSTAIQVGILYGFGKPFTLSWEWIKSDLFWMPLQDALYAAAAVAFPLSLLSTPRWRSVNRRKI